MPDPQTPRLNKPLVVILHGFTCKPSSYDYVKKQVTDHYPGADVRVPNMKLGTFSGADPNELVGNIIAIIDTAWQTGRYDGIILIGHSCGALLARKVYVYACGENTDAPFELEGYAEPKPWATKVDRIILLAGMNRGWTINMHLSLADAFVWRVGSFIAGVMAEIGHKVFIMRMRRGAPFITQLRIQWLSMLGRIDTKGAGNTMVVQLLGTIDDLVSPDDNVDLVTGNDFYYLEMPSSGHRDVLDMDDTKAGEARAKVFASALTLSKEALDATQTHSAEEQPLEQHHNVTDVIFVIHGIRDAGYWTKKLARRVQILGNQQSPNRKFETETSTYGYFPMLHFLLSASRQQKVEWLMDQYTENRALYPNADFSYIGHSNGTYLLAKALKDYPACRFKNVVFAGSVVRKDYQWQEMKANNRIKSIVNLVASADWIVAIFPKAFQTLRFQDLGSGGHDGFIALDATSQVSYIEGSHGAGVKEELWDSIADIIVNGPPQTLSIGTPVLKQNPIIKTMGLISPLLFLLVIVLIFVLGCLLVSSLDRYGAVIQTIAAVFYLSAIWWIITKV